MSTALPRHVIDFASDLAPRETEINDPAVVDAPYRSKSWRHFVQPGKTPWPASGRRDRTASAVSAITTSCVTSLKAACA